MHNNNRNTSFVRQAAILGLASLFVRLIGFAYRIPLTHRLGDAGMGFYNIAYYVYAFVIVITSGALPASVSRLVSERLAKKQYRNAHELFKTAMFYGIFIGVFVGIVMWFGADWFAMLFNSPESAYGIRALAPAVFIVAMLAVFRGYFQGMKTTMPTAVSQVVEQIFNVVFTVWLAFLFFDAARLQYSVAGGAAGTGIGALAAVGVIGFVYFLVSDKLKERVNSDMGHGLFESRGSQLKIILRCSLPIIVGMGVYSAATLIDFAMASDRLEASGVWTDDEINIFIGQFSNKFILLTTLPVSLSVALSAAVLPDITTSQVEMDINAIRAKTNMALRVSMIMSLPAAVGLSVLADPILHLLFPAFPDGGWLLTFGGVSIIFLAMVQIFTGVLQGIGRVGIPLIGAIFGTLAKIPVNYFLVVIPEINILGVVISTIVCYVVASIINLYFLWKFTGIMPDFRGALLKPLIASGAMGLVAFLSYNLAAWVAPGQVATIFALFVSVLAYFAFMVLIRGLS